jgi:hypothetical protein
LLYQFDQDPFFELVSDRPDVLRKVVGTIVRTLRARTEDLTAMQVRSGAGRSG